MPNYREHFREIRDILRKEAAAYSSDLDIDLTNDKEQDVHEIKINFRASHRFYKQFNQFFDNINEGRFKNYDYERFLFNLLLDTPRCEHCLAPLENNNEVIKQHIDYYHFGIKI